MKTTTKQKPVVFAVRYTPRENGSAEGEVDVQGNPDDIAHMLLSIGDKYIAVRAVLLHVAGHINGNHEPDPKVLLDLLKELASGKAKGKVEVTHVHVGGKEKNPLKRND